MRRRAAVLAVALGGLAAIWPAAADARRSTCAARGAHTVVADAAVRVYARHGHTWACAHANGRRFELGRGSEPFQEGRYGIEHIRLRGSRVAYAVAQDGVDYTVSSVWVRDVRAGRNLVANADPVVREDVCAVGDGRELDDLLLGPRGHLAWTTTYTCAPGIGTPRVEVVGFARGAGRRLLDSAPYPDIDGFSLAGTERRAYWLHGGVARSATF